MGLPIGQHVYLKCMGRDKDGNEIEAIQRAYTPFSGNELKGYLDILIKVYFPTKEFPEGGEMTCAARVTQGWSRLCRSEGTTGSLYLRERKRNERSQASSKD